jgi:hypothetical protein
MIYLFAGLESLSSIDFCFILKKCLKEEKEGEKEWSRSMTLTFIHFCPHKKMITDKKRSMHLYLAIFSSSVEIKLLGCRKQSNHFDIITGF